MGSLLQAGKRWFIRLDDRLEVELVTLATSPFLVLESGANQA